MPDAPSSAGMGTFIALLIFIVASVWLGTVAHRVVQKGSFLKGYFLGNRGLGSWAIALTATVQSGGTFMGFPSLVFSHGWIVALWIGSYMVVPLSGFGVLGKRIAQLSRRTGAITVPDLLRERFGSPLVGLLALIFILVFLGFMMVAQFKAGALIMKVAWPGSGALALVEDAEGGFDRYYYLGLTIFALTVVGYTLIGGFLAAVWTDLFQSVMMLFGVLALLFFVVPAAGGLEQATLTAAEATGPEYVFGPGYTPWDKNERATPPPPREFHTVGLALSFFFVWVFAGLGSPASMVRVMACKDTRTIRRSIFLLNAYNAMIYLPLVVICICGRALLPDLPPKYSDEIIPRLAITTTSDLPGGSLLAGLILAAPFGAVMSTVSSYLVVLASGIVRDLYQRLLRPAATEAQIKRLTYGAMIAIGGIAFAANLSPVVYLQAIVVFSGTSAAATFVVPALMTAFWRRATAVGAMAAMLAGAGAMLALYITGWTLSGMGYDPMIGQASKFRPYYWFGLDPLLWGLSASVLAGAVGSWLTKPPDAARVSLLFDAPPEGGTDAAGPEPSRNP